MGVRNLLLISSSTVHGYEYLQYVKTEIREFLLRKRVKKILFIPYALPDYDNYYKRVNDVFTSWDFELESIHDLKKPVEAVLKAEAFLVGGGNTFLLLNTLYEKRLVPYLRNRVLKDGIPYIGTSAGTNVATASIHTTNDMPIIYPPTFDALRLVPFNINPHYQDADENSTHKGETREERILQLLEVSTKTVLAMREGVHLLIENGVAVLKGINKSRLFIRGQEPIELDSGTDVSFLLQEA